MTRFFALVVLLVAVGCGSPEEPLTPSVSTSKASAVQADTPEATRPSTVKTLKPGDKTKTKGGNDPLAKALDDPPGDLLVVFTNNVDGEIEPCG
ncbi:MAG: hypothetical protein KDA24_03555 [Deltaproteobacteria bacterium]|nr:hypothetical protein [Deltaproteobacteria bacterium]